MRRVFTRLTSGRQRILHPWWKSVFLEDPDCATLVRVVNSNGNKKTKKLAQGTRETPFFFSFYFFISFILLIEFLCTYSYVLTLKS